MAAAAYRKPRSGSALFRACRACTASARRALVREGQGDDAQAAHFDQPRDAFGRAGA